MEASSSIIQSKRGIMDEGNQEEIDNCLCSDYEDDESINSICSSSSTEFTEDATSSSSSSSSSSTLSLCPAQLSSDQMEEGPLFQMSALIAQLPAFKRGLSKHFNGKSQSFTSFANVTSLEDLAKPERPFKRFKSSKSCTVLASRRALLPRFSSRAITKRSSLSGTKHSPPGSKRSIFAHGSAPVCLKEFSL